MSEINIYAKAIRKDLNTAKANSKVIKVAESTRNVAKLDIPIQMAAWYVERDVPVVDGHKGTRPQKDALKAIRKEVESATGMSEGETKSKHDEAIGLLRDKRTAPFASKPSDLLVFLKDVQWGDSDTPNVGVSNVADLRRFLGIERKASPGTQAATFAKRNGSKSIEEAGKLYVKLLKTADAKKVFAKDAKKA